MIQRNMGCIPRLRKGSYYPEWLLERRKPAEQALLSVIMEAYVNGVSAHKVERLVSEMGLDHLDKSTVFRISKGLDQRVKEFTEHPKMNTRLFGLMPHIPRYVKMEKCKARLWLSVQEYGKMVIVRYWVFPWGQQKRKNSGWSF